MWLDSKLIGHSDQSERVFEINRVVRLHLTLRIYLINSDLRTSSENFTERSALNSSNAFKWSLRNRWCLRIFDAQKEINFLLLIIIEKAQICKVSAIQRIRWNFPINKLIRMSHHRQQMLKLTFAYTFNSFFKYCKMVYESFWYAFEDHKTQKPHLKF